MTPDARLDVRAIGSAVLAKPFGVFRYQSARCSIERVKCAMARTFGVLLLSGSIVGTPVFALHAAPQSTNQTSLVFEVASIKPSGVNLPFSFRIEPNGTTAASGITLKRLLMTAYNMQGFRIIGGPAWVDSQQWELRARHEGVVTPQQ